MKEAFAGAESQQKAAFVGVGAVRLASTTKSHVASKQRRAMQGNPSAACRQSLLRFDLAMAVLLDDGQQLVQADGFCEKHPRSAISLALVAYVRAHDDDGGRA